MLQIALSFLYHNVCPKKSCVPRKAWSAMFFSIFYHHGIQQNQQQHCRSAFWKGLSFILSYIILGVPWWLGGYSTWFWKRRMGFDSSSQSTLYGLKLISIKIHEKKFVIKSPIFEKHLAINQGAKYSHFD